MQYIKNIGIKAKKAFENLNKVKHNDIKKVLQTFNKSILSNKNSILKENTWLIDWS